MGISFNWWGQVSGRTCTLLQPSSYKDAAGSSQHHRGWHGQLWSVWLGEVSWRSVKMLLLPLRAVPGISQVPGSQESTETFQLGPEEWLQVCPTKKNGKGKSRQKKKNLQRHRRIQRMRARLKWEADSAVLGMRKGGQAESVIDHNNQGLLVLTINEWWGRESLRHTDDVITRSKAFSLISPTALFNRPVLSTPVTNPPDSRPPWRQLKEHHWAGGGRGTSEEAETQACCRRPGASLREPQTLGIG